MTHPADDATTCDYSDLPKKACAHCTGATLGGPFRLPPLTVVHPVAHHPATRRPAALLTPAVTIPETGAQDLHDYVAELVDRTRQATPYDVDAPAGGYRIQQRHHVTVPPLLEQLATAIHTSGGAGASAGGYESRPAARLELVDTLTHIETSAYRWLKTLTGTPRADLVDTWPTLTGAIRHLRALAADLERCYRIRGRRLDEHDDPARAGCWCCAFHELEHDVRSWWVAARTVSGWEAAAWKPHNTCPLCGVRDSLRIRADVHTGVCTACHETWDATTIGLLADHIRAENLEDDEDMPEAETA